MIKLENALLRRKTFTLGPISRIFRDGEAVAVMGRNGSGKTSLLDVLSGLEPLTEGGIKADSSISYAPQESDDSFFLPTVFDEVSYSLRGSVRHDLRTKAEELLCSVDLDPSFLERSPFSLSGGEKRLLSIALALASRPSFLLLDESISGLDHKGYMALRRLIGKLKGEGTALIMVTHDEGILDLMDGLIVMDSGRIIFDGAPIDAMKMNLIERTFTYTKSLELFGTPFLSFDELIRRRNE